MSREVLGGEKARGALATGVGGAGDLASDLSPAQSTATASIAPSTSEVRCWWSEGA